jgi:predicted nucleotidyltransferase
MNKYGLEDEDYHILYSIIKPLKNHVYIFGSRAKGASKPFSDIDLYIEGKITADELTRIIDAFAESNLPVKVDIVHDISATFLKSIQADLIRIH